MSDKKKGAVIALGFFDSVHLGHVKVIKSARDYADKQASELVVFTFDGNLKSFITGSREKNVCTFSERKKLIMDIGADEIRFAPVTKEFLSQDKRAFLDWLNGEYNVICYVSGRDYRFGKGGQGTVKDIEEYAKSHGQEQIIVDLLTYGDQKISTSRIKELLASGDIEMANLLLGRNFSVSGKVYSDRGVGESLGYPTLNLKADDDKIELKSGVYSGRVEIDNKEYKAIINNGGRPTFDLYNKVIEAHLLDFNGNLYEKIVTVKFNRYLRDTVKFKDSKSLIRQLKMDEQSVRGEKV